MGCSDALQPASLVTVLHIHTSTIKPTHSLHSRWLWVHTELPSRQHSHLDKTKLQSYPTMQAPWGSLLCCPTHQSYCPAQNQGSARNCGAQHRRSYLRAAHGSTSLQVIKQHPAAPSTEKPLIWFRLLHPNSLGNSDSRTEHLAARAHRRTYRMANPSPPWNISATLTTATSQGNS